MKLIKYLFECNEILLRKNEFFKFLLDVAALIRTKATTTWLSGEDPNLTSPPFFSRFFLNLKTQTGKFLQTNSKNWRVPASFSFYSMTTLAGGPSLSLLEMHTSVNTKVSELTLLTYLVTVCSLLILTECWHDVLILEISPIISHAFLLWKIQYSRVFAMKHTQLWRPLTLICLSSSFTRTAFIMTMMI